MDDWVIRLIDWGGYAGIFLLSLLETIVLPLPSEVILPLAGMRAADGPLGFAGVVLAATAGSMTGNTVWYFAARAVGLERLRRFVERRGRWLALEWDDVERVHAHFDRFGAGIVLVGRLVPVVRTFVSIPAGLVGMGLGRYLLWSSIGTAGFAFLLAGAGYVAGANVHWIEEVAAPVSSAVIVAILCWYVWRQLTWHSRAAARALKRAAAAAAAAPIEG